MATATAHASSAKILPGEPYPLDSNFDGRGTNFSIFSEVAERVELCLFDEEGRETKINLEERDGYNWHVYLNGVGPGQQYGYRIHGPWNPKEGLRCCPNKLLLDPNCKAISGAIQWSDALFPYRMDKTEAAACSSSDDAHLMMKSVVHNPYFNWDNEYRSHTPLEDTIIYELHVKGFTKCHPRLIHLRRDHPVFHRRGWYQGRSIRGSALLDDIGWFRPDGSGMSADEWQKGYIKSLQVFLNGDLGYVDRRGEPVRDDDFLLLFNAHWEDVFFQPALIEKERPWQIVLNTSKRIENGTAGKKQSGGLQIKAEGRSVIVLTRPCNPCGRTGPLGI